MTKKEKATRRYIFRELRRHAMVKCVEYPDSGRDKGNIIFHLDVDAEGILAVVLGRKPFTATALVIPDEVTFYANRSCARLREILNVKIFNAFMDYEGDLINAIEDRLGIPVKERMGSGG